MVMLNSESSPLSVGIIDKRANHTEGERKVQRNSEKREVRIAPGSTIQGSRQHQSIFVTLSLVPIFNINLSNRSNRPLTQCMNLVDAWRAFEHFASASQTA